jgi:hypothetical protein
MEERRPKLFLERLVIYRFKIWGSHGGENADCDLLNCDAVQSCRWCAVDCDDLLSLCAVYTRPWRPTFRRSILSPSSGLKWDSMFLRDVGIYRRVYMAPKPRRFTIVSKDADGSVTFLWNIGLITTYKSTRRHSLEIAFYNYRFHSRLLIDLTNT